MCDGAIIPHETVVHCIMRHLGVGEFKKSYVIDGFPRAIDQAQYFEQCVCEIQSIIHYEIPMENMIERLNERCRDSKRIDDNFDVIKKRMANYNDQVLPVYDYYKTFGRIRTINATQEESKIQEDTRNALMPQIMCIIGAKKSGKTTLASQASVRTNYKLINFRDFIKNNGLKGKDDETLVLELINSFFFEI